MNASLPASRFRWFKILLFVILAIIAAPITLAFLLASVSGDRR
jgi:hypothetical protein